MRVFKTYYKVLWKNKAPIILYVVIFAAFAILFALNDQSTPVAFESSRISVAVLDRDGSALSGAVKKHMGKVCSLVELPDEPERLQDELFYRNVNLIVILPGGFGQSFDAGTSQAEIVKPDASAESFAAEQKLTSFLGTLGRYRSAGYSLKEAVQFAEQDGAVATEVSVLDTGALTDAEFQFTALFRFMSYSVLVLMILGISTIMLTFYQKDLRNRCECAPFSKRRQNLELLLAAGLYALVVWLIFSASSLFLYGFDLLRSPYWWFCVLNAFTYTIVSISIGFCVGIFAKTPTIQSAAANTISLAMSFLGGVFVPQELLDENVLRVASFLPTYWNVRLTESLQGITGFTAGNLSIVWQCLLIQLAFAVAIMSVSMLISRERARAN